MAEKVIGKLSIDELATFCKRKGLVFRSSEIYGGFSGFWDYGPSGVELFQNLKQDFWKWFVQRREDVVGIEASIISHPRTWRASGHLASFADIAVICKKCKKATKIGPLELGKAVCPDCGGELASQGAFNLMFKTSVGALNPTDAYLRGETAQAMFMDFKQIAETSRMQLPFGVVQIGRCFRNEIAPRDFLFRSREFTIAEFEFFIHPEEKKCEKLDSKHKSVKIKLLDAETQEKGKDTLKQTTIGEMVKASKLDEWHGYWLAEQVMWFEHLGIADKIKIREHMKDELSHYSSATFDLDYEFPFGSKEIAGNANRGQYDLTQHQKESGQKIDVFDESSKKRIVPKVIEPTFGMDRVFLALLCSAYTPDTKRENVVLRLPRFLAPVKAAIFPLISKGPSMDLARHIQEYLREDFAVAFDASGSIGRRYARQDEAGTPYCITVDEDSLKDKAVTIRDRDTTKQIRVKVDDLQETLRMLISGKLAFEKAGKVVETRVK
ncbi:glycine--tRNA ligase [Candidatus Pacearchaeota archaeon]|nr:glycine--tRNA ligase [Candidatus Pacearchaeota archaeon]